jgi:hypothetical protein
LHACASFPGAPHDPQSASVAHAVGHFAAHVSVVVHVSVDWQLVTFDESHPTHLDDAGSHTRCCGSHAAQSASAWHVTVGFFDASTGHVTPFGTQFPYCVQ